MASELRSYLEELLDLLSSGSDALGWNDAGDAVVVYSVEG